MVLGVIGTSDAVRSVMAETGLKFLAATTNKALVPEVEKGLIRAISAMAPDTRWIGVTCVLDHVDFERGGGLKGFLARAEESGGSAIHAERWDRIAADGELHPPPERGALRKRYPLACALTAEIAWQSTRQKVLWHRYRGHREAQAEPDPAPGSLIAWRYGWDESALERMVDLVAPGGATAVSEMKARWKKRAAFSFWEPESPVWKAQLAQRRMAANPVRILRPPTSLPPGRAMDLENDFPLRFYINVHSNAPRRFEVKAHLHERGLEGVERFPAIDKHWVRDFRGHWSEGRYALALTQKLVVREGRRRGAPAVLIFEDDVVLDEDFIEKSNQLHLPDDWGLFYFGCKHLQPPDAIAPGVVRVREAWDLHAVAVRESRYAEVMAVLSPTGKGKVRNAVEPSDRAIAELMATIPTYAAWPNLAWQRAHPSSVLDGWTNDNYDAQGRQMNHLEAVAHLPRAMRELAASPE